VAVASEFGLKFVALGAVLFESTGCAQPRFTMSAVLFKALAVWKQGRQRRVADVAQFD